MLRYGLHIILLAGFILSCQKNSVHEFDFDLATRPPRNVQETYANLSATILTMNRVDLDQHGFVVKDLSNNADSLLKKLGKRVAPGNYNGIIFNLDSNTTYSVQAYARKDQKLYFGNILTFKTR